MKESQIRCFVGLAWIELGLTAAWQQRLARAVSRERLDPAGLVDLRDLHAVCRDEHRRQI